MTIDHRHSVLQSIELKQPTPATARAAARRHTPRAAFRGVPVFDGQWAAQVHQDCESADPLTPRLWAPRVSR